jgi:flagellar hook-associated protein 2
MKPVGTTPLSFTGISKFSNDFQTILSHSVQVAQIPVSQLQSKDSNILQQKALLGSLQTAVTNLAGSLSTLGTVGSTKALSASSSNSSVVTASATARTNAAAYTIDSITSAGSAASERSTIGYADAGSTPVSTSGDVTLQIGSNTKTFTLANNNLTSLRDQINGLNLGVTASILTTSDGNYLTVSANATGHTTLKLFDGDDTTGTNLITSTNQGTDAYSS